MCGKSTRVERLEIYLSDSIPEFLQAHIYISAVLPLTLS
jgi:hypothetical protein